MQRTINLYALSRVPSGDCFNQFEKAYSQRQVKALTQDHEISSLHHFVDWLMEEGVEIYQLDGFYFSFKIPQISKEFDLLKFNENECLNIELKSEPVPETKIKDQLIKNRHYLSHIGKKIYSFTI